ncbi:hypothetical protein H8D36_04820 [archaeon]|nr:hypothetical protein [archaeon]MBL7057453.1 hypothetical protein [Candidatus Woesearchaeota archaeon]
MIRNKTMEQVLILLVIAVFIPSVALAAVDPNPTGGNLLGSGGGTATASGMRVGDTGSSTGSTTSSNSGVGLNTNMIYTPSGFGTGSNSRGVGLRLDSVFKPRDTGSMGLLTKNDEGEFEVKDIKIDFRDSWRQYFSDNLNPSKRKGPSFWQSMSNADHFATYYGEWDAAGWMTWTGTTLNFADMVADVSKLFGWENEAHMKNMDEFFSTKLGKVVDADNWESNLCMAMGAGGESRTVIVSSSSSSDSYQGMSGAYIRAQKSTAFEVPNGTSYKYYFVDWYIASLKKEGLKVDVKLYKSNGHSESMLEEVKILGAASPWKSGVQMIQSDQNYEKVCLEFLSPSLGDYFEFYSLDNNRICQKINSVD